MTITTAEALPAVVTAVGARVPVLVDGGIRTGEDVLRALALGAAAILVGRPVARALRTGGAEGARVALDTPRAELELAMALGGVPDLAAATTLGLRHATETPRG
ncbi:alpha-hydroxy-acid oxidizing protein [Frankia sp. AgPm24]|uniref:alpha-hydroxy-acid oxidizing protein n=1 Tax=Frankia sp. AgPm24 TaxID=631128 RepID=UPI002551FD74|nr:alpha-hydroxy-acid oxidizing protein [Frankia sp. AgPm24]